MSCGTRGGLEGGGTVAYAAPASTRGAHDGMAEKVGKQGDRSMRDDSQSAGLSISLDNYEQFLPRPINSPRSLEACLRQGVDPKELVPHRVEDFMEQGTEREFAEMQHQHFERKRKGGTAPGRGWGGARADPRLRRDRREAEAV